jgi:dTDP-glucose 4,6-dehydratase
MHVLVTGGAGFLGSHLCDSLLSRGDTVSCLDDLSTGDLANIAHRLQAPGFEFIKADISSGTGGLEGAGQIDAVVHMASPASPPAYLRRPLETLAVGSRGTEHALQVALRHNARFVLASTSEVYGDPYVHPQPEDYWGNVNPIGPRSVYDEAKRFAEALTAAYARTMGVNAGIIRIFNTYGPRLRPSDGRVVSNFIWQALHGEPLTVYGDGTQTRSLCYVDDLIRGITAMIDCREFGPVNLGNPEELTVGELAQLVLTVTGSGSPVEYRVLPQDDPVRRRPQIARARRLLGWEPQISVRDGIERTVAWFSTPAVLAGAS